MKQIIKFTFFLILLLPSYEGSAHEGHGIIPNGVLHYLFTPEHAFMMLVLIAVGIIWYYKKHRSYA